MDGRNSNIGPTGGLSRDTYLISPKHSTVDAKDWEETSNTTNPVKSIKRQSFKSKNNLNIILENILIGQNSHRENGGKILRYKHN